ncbi:hypothetical protein [Variovorax atrisoli]|uniref:hypothetical protein n=1 Tax=Variovorax atrisoli TaxID=3394203 RepID=UPI003392D6C9
MDTKPFGAALPMQARLAECWTPMYSHIGQKWENFRMHARPVRQTSPFECSIVRTSLPSRVESLAADAPGSLAPNFASNIARLLLPMPAAEAKGQTPRPKHVRGLRPHTPFGIRCIDFISRYAYLDP